MHSFLIPSLYIATGFMAYAAVQHFASVTSLRRDVDQLLFAVLCVLEVPFSLCHIQTLQAHTPADFIFWLRCSLAVVMPLYCLSAWFIALHTDKRFRLFLLGLSLWFAILFVVNWMLPLSVQYARLDGIYQQALPWGELITRGDGANGFWSLATIVGALAVHGFTAFALTSKYRKSRERNALAMLAAYAIWMLSSVLGILSRLSLIQFFELAPLAFVFMIIVMSVTLSSEAKQRLRTSERHFRSLFDSSPTGMIAIDPKYWCIVQANQHALAMTGLSAEELLTKTVLDLIDPADQHVAERMLGFRQLAEGTLSQLSYEERYRRSDGSHFDGHSFVSALRDERGHISQFIISTIDITHRKKTEREIAHLAFYDHLTDLPNRRMFLDSMDRALMLAKAQQRCGALLLIDIDDFKTLNDTHGHMMGDAFLHQLTERLRGCFTNGELLARLGGDEFGVNLNSLNGEMDIAREETKHVVERVYAALAPPFQLALHQHRCTVCMGVILFDAQSSSKDELIKQADIALTEAKHKGRNHVRFFEPAMQDAINRRAALEIELHGALDTGQFCLHFQVQVDSSNQPVGAEALLRWQHPERGLIAPALFVPMAEETGLIVPIGAWVLRSACEQLKAWKNDAATCDLVLAVNVSALQFRQPDFIVQVAHAVRSVGINPKRLKLELTESLLVVNFEDTIATMLALSRIGVQLSLDDFGTGYSSLQYLKRLPINQIKIDQSFVQGIVVSSSDRAIVRTIIAMTQGLGLDVIAEGIDTEEQRTLLIDKGCALFQGYLFGKPMPLHEFEAALRLGFSRAQCTNIKC